MRQQQELLFSISSMWCFILVFSLGRYKNPREDAMRKKGESRLVGDRVASERGELRLLNVSQPNVEKLTSTNLIKTEDNVDEMQIYPFILLARVYFIFFFNFLILFFFFFLYFVFFIFFLFFSFFFLLGEG